MRVNVDFATHADIIEFEPFMGKNIRKYQKEFEKWYYIKEYEVINGKKTCCFVPRNDLPYEYFDSRPIIHWLKFVCPTCNPKIIKEQVSIEKIDKSLPTMYF